MSTQARYSLTTLAEAKIDAEAGIIRDVAIMTEGEAAGHGLRVDTATLQSLYSMSGNGGVKAFLNHSAMPSPAEAVGIFSGFYIDPAKDDQPAKLRATFKALRAFREHSPREYATLFELAADAPGSFGVSVSIWQDEEEAEDGGNPYIRPTVFESADFVSAPAANASLFSANSGIDKTNTEPKSVSRDQIHRFSMKLAYSKFSAKPELLAKAVKYMAESPDMTEESAVETVEKEAQLAEAEEMQKQIEALMAENAALKAQIEQIESKAKADLAQLSAEHDAAKTKLRRYGVSALTLTKLSREAAPAEATCTAEEFAAKSPAQKIEFSRKGGRIVD